MSIAYAFGMIILGYLLGSIPTGYWLVKALKGIDIRQVGSGSTGATNVLRTAGKGAGLFVLIADIMKGFVPVYIAAVQESLWSTLPFNFPHMVPVLVAIIAVVGHSKSIFLNFTGGKSAATTLGGLYGLNPLGATLTFGLWILLVFVTRIVSLASIVTAIACAVIMHLCGSPPAVTGFAVAAGAYVVIRHKANIRRILAGTEAKLGDKAKPLVEANSSAAATKTESKPEGSQSTEDSKTSKE